MYICARAPLRAYVRLFVSLLVCLFLRASVDFIYICVLGPLSICVCTCESIPSFMFRMFFFVFLCIPLS